jgi:type IX secretion system PorP/SprF family membrane protein
MIKFYFLLTFLLLNLAAEAQQLPVFSQYFNNPYIYNPAFAGTKNAAYIFLNHRQQWRGIEGAPVTSSFIFHTPVSRRAALGINMYTDKRGLITTSSALASFGYTVPFGFNHFLRFGISAGLGSNNLDFSKVDNINDPAVLKLMSDNIYLDGQFGINYQNKNLNLGFALPKLYESTAFSYNYFSDLEVGRLRRYLFSGSYKFELGPDYSLDPQLLYRMTEGLPDMIEGGLVLNLKDIIWIGGNYRKDYGATALFGFNINNQFNVGYAYEIAKSQVSTFAGGTHEIQIGIRLGKYKDPNRKKVQEEEQDLLPVNNINEEKEEIISIIEEKEEVQMEEELIEEPEVIIKTEENYKEVTLTRGKHPLELENGHYVIAGVFKHERNAKRYRDALKDRGYSTQYGYNSENNYYYVYLHLSDDKKKTKQETFKYRMKHEFKDAWLLTIKNSTEPENKLNEKETTKPASEAIVPIDMNSAPVFQEGQINILLSKGEILMVQKGNTPQDLGKGYYLIAAAYDARDKAEKYQEILRKEGINNSVGFSSEKQMYVIYISHTEDETKIRSDQDKYAENEKLRDSWVLKIE